MLKQFTYLISALGEDGEYVGIESSVLAVDQAHAEEHIESHFIVNQPLKLISVSHHGAGHTIKIKGR